MKIYCSFILILTFVYVGKLSSQQSIAMKSKTKGLSDNLLFLYLTILALILKYKQLNK